MRQSLPIALLLTLAAHADGPRPGDPATPRAGDEVVACGRYFHTTAKVVLWTDPGGFDAYRVDKRFGPIEAAGHRDTLVGGRLRSPARYGLRRHGLSTEEVERVRGGGWDLPLLHTLDNAMNFSVSAIWHTGDGIARPVDGLYINQTARATKVAFFSCPSDTNVPGGGDPSGLGVSYPNNAGLNRYNNNWQSVGPTYYQGGDSSLCRTLSFASITDGQTNTVMFSEYVKGKGTNNADGLNQAYYMEVTTLPQGIVQADNQLAQLCDQVKLRQWDYKGECWMVQDNGRGGGFCMTQTPNRKACVDKNINSTDNLIGASSKHPGGVNCLMVDGSVRFIKSTVNIDTWHALATIAGGEIINGDAF